MVTSLAGHSSSLLDFSRRLSHNAFDCSGAAYPALGFGPAPDWRRKRGFLLGTHSIHGGRYIVDHLLSYRPLSIHGGRFAFAANSKLAFLRVKDFAQFPFAIHVRNFGKSLTHEAIRPDSRKSPNPHVSLFPIHGGDFFLHLLRGDHSFQDHVCEAMRE
jgi:hypothetical protein